MTKAELIKLLSPYPNDIRLVMCVGDYSGRDDVGGVVAEEIVLDCHAGHAWKLPHSDPTFASDNTIIQKPPTKVLCII